MSEIKLTAEWDKEKQEVIRYDPPRRVCSFCYEGMIYDPQKGIWECTSCGTISEGHSPCQLEENQGVTS